MYTGHHEAYQAAFPLSLNAFLHSLLPRPLSWETFSLSVGLPLGLTGLSPHPNIGVGCRGWTYNPIYNTGSGKGKGPFRDVTVRILFLPSVRPCVFCPLAD